MIHRFAVFGDVHGRVALMLTLARRWQQEARLPLDGILQVGDMGAFPDHDRLDRSTRRYARHDPDELGFRDFLSPSPDAVSLLSPPDTPPIVFCRGNHEDFGYLSQHREPSPMDPWGKLWFVPDGQVLPWPIGAPELLRIGAFGAAAPLRPPAAERRGRSARRSRRKADRAELSLSMGPRFRLKDLQRVLSAELGPIDVLLTHAGPLHPAWRGGSPHLTRLAQALKPRVHLFGHHHQVVGPLSTPNGLLVGLEHLEFIEDNTLRPGAWGILSLDGASARFEWVDRQTYPWVARFTRFSWRSLAQEARSEQERAP
ncbi:MAG TPA: hypothetical protein ENK18_10455 [Deltaproteobacteria bacterium]|nr:hypothetical protein [Deltaproteobacteria bacterium]